MRPLIGISASIKENDDLGWSFHRLPSTYSIALERVGAAPVIIPNGLCDESLRTLYQRLDGVLLSGGGDLDPELYHALPHPKTGRICAARDETEIALSRWAYEDDRPLFGICRGIQSLAVALGGTLLQDIPDHVGEDYPHSLKSEEPPHNLHAHSVSILPKSLLAELLGSTRLGVNSLHHQSVERMPPGFIATAHSPDGMIEAMEAPGSAFCLAVQWHPEDMIDSDPLMLRLFAGFAEACRQHQTVTMC